MDTNTASLQDEATPAHADAPGIADPAPAGPRPNTPARTDTANVAYHRLGASRRGWWRPALTCLLVLLAVQLTITVVQVASLLLPDAPILGVHTDLLLSFVGIAAALPLIFATVRWVERRPPGTLSSVTGRLRWPWLARCLLLAVPAVAILLAGLVVLPALTGATPPTPDEPAAPVGATRYLIISLVALLVVAGQVATEEYICRGVLLQALGRLRRGPWLAIVAQAVPFAALHGWGTPWGALSALTVGALLGWTAVRTGGLEAGLAFHWILNAAIMLLVVARDRPVNADANISDSPWQHALVQVTALGLYAAAVAWTARRTRIATTTTSSPATGPEQVAP